MDATLDISVVVPLYNEEESLPELVEWIDRVARGEGLSYEVILVDDGSGDGSWRVIESLHERFAAVRGIKFARNYGKSAALYCGFAEARGEVVFTMDADLQDSPDEIPALRHMVLDEGYDLVSGWKKKRHDPAGKRWPSKFFNWTARIVSGIRLHDFNCGLKAYRRRVVKAIEVYGEMHRYIPILAKQAGFDMVQVHGDRMCGSFSSSIFNHRTDEYGGSAENRARFAVEAVKAVHAAVPEFPIDYKLAVRQEDPHYGNAGVLVEELPVFVPLLEQAGVTSFHVTLANHSALENTIPPASHPAFGQPGCFLKFCDEVRRYTSVPLCGVGGLNDPDFVEQQLASGRIQCAAMSRQLLADPEWVNKLQKGQAKTIHRCVRCNKKGRGGLMAHQGTRCIYDARREEK